MAGAKFSITAENADEIRGQINKLLERGVNLTDAFRDIGEELLVTHEQRFRDQTSPDGAPWVPLSETTLELKPHHKDTILTLNSILSGKLSYAATNTDLFFGTNTEYGAMHQFGGITAPGSMIPGVVIPARPWLGISESDKDWIFGILGDHLIDG
jgi:phage virion morphogenesis protein